MSGQLPPWSEVAAALGTPVYGVPGIAPNASYGALLASGSHDEPESINLGFGEWERMLVVETSIEPVSVTPMILELFLNLEPQYPFTIQERTIQIPVDGHLFDFRTFWITERSWSGVTKVADRWVHLRGIGAALDYVVVGTIL